MIVIIVIIQSNINWNVYMSNYMSMYKLYTITAFLLMILMIYWRLRQVTHTIHSVPGDQTKYSD